MFGLPALPGFLDFVFKELFEVGCDVWLTDKRNPVSDLWRTFSKISEPRRDHPFVQAYILVCPVEQCCLSLGSFLVVHLDVAGESGWSDSGLTNYQRSDFVDNSA